MNTTTLSHAARPPAARPPVALLILIASALCAGCGGSGGSKPKGAASTGAALTTRTLGPLVQDTLALPGLSQGHAAAVVGDFALVTGGATALESASARVTELELESGQTRPRPERMVVARSGHALYFSPRGEWLALAGVDASGAPLSSIERYVPSLERWVLDPRTLPLSGRVGSVVSDDHLCLVAAGHPFVEIFDLASLDWSGSYPLAGPPSETPTLIHLAGRGELIYVHSEFPAFVELDAGVGAALPGDLVPQGGASVLPVADFGVLFIGGYDAEGEPLRRARYLEALAPAPLPVGPELPPVVGASAAWLVDGSVLVAGGSWEGRLLDRALRFDLEGAVERLAPLGEARDRITLVSGAGRVALIGGRGANGPSALIDLVSFRELAPTQAFAEAAKNRQRKFDQLTSIADLRDERAEAELELNEIVARVGTTQAALDAATATRDALNLELGRSEAARLKAEAEVARLSTEERALISERDRLLAAATRDQLALSSTQAELDRLQFELAQAQASQSSQESRSAGLQGQLSQAQGQVNSARQDLTSLEAQTAQLVIAKPISTPSHGAVGVTFSSAPAPASTSRATLTPLPAAPVQTAAAQTPAAQSAPATNYGGVYSWESILARLNGATR